MYRVLIVDDEPIIRLGLQKMIQWEKEGFVVVKDVKNGQEAIEFIHDEDIDLIITDISMPKMDGIELIREVRKHNKSIKVIFLTGYREFEYAVEGIKLNVEDYLLKPIDPKELKRVLIKIKKILDDKYELENIIESKGIIDIIQGKDKNLKLLEKHMQKEYLTVCKVEIDDFDNIAEKWITDNNYELNIKAIKRVLSENIDSKSIFLEGEIGNYYLVVESDENKIEGLSKIKELDISTSTNEFKLKSLVGSTVIKSNIAESYISLLKKKDIKVSTILDNKRSDLLSVIKEKEFIKLVTEGNEQVFSIIESIYSMVESNRVDTNIVAISLQNIVEKIVEKMRKEYGYIDKLTTIDNYEYFYKREYKDYVTLLNDFKKVISSIVYIFGTIKIEFKDNIIRQACKFVVENIDKDVSLTIVSDELKLSKNYLCTLFKNETGENFLSFVTRTKMERAKFLLRNNNMKVYEVCDFLGYNDTTYFTRIFKKYVNMTPYEYKRIGD